MRRLALSAALTIGALALFPYAADAAFPGANGRITFGSISPPNAPIEDQFDIETINPDGSGRMNLTAGDPVALEPRWSPDGKRIAFITRVGDYEIYVMNADGTGKTNITNNDVHDEAPAWSPDGTQIVFSTGRRGNEDIYVMNADGKKPVRVTEDPAWDSDPVWSADGSKIAFVRNRDGAYQIYTVRPDGSDETNISGSAVYEQHPDWSPDGTRLVFSSGCNLFTMNADGSGKTEIPTGGVGSGGFWPAWSPDGTRIAFTVCGLGTSTDVATVNLDGTEAVNVTNNPDAHEDWPDWQPLLYAPPVCHGGPEITLLATGKFELVTLDGATGLNGSPVDITITTITQDEPVHGPQDHTSPDALLGPQANAVYLRTERAPRGDGRVYRVGFSASDREGRTCTGTKKVSVPRGQLPAIDSAPPSFNAFER